MVDEEQNYTDSSDEEEGEEGAGSGEESDDDGESVVSSQSSVSSKASTIKPKSVSSASTASLKPLVRIPARVSVGKENFELCRGHRWDHNCKNKDCPNRKKQQQHHK